MNYIDFAIAVSLFIFFFAAVIMFTTNYFSRYSGLTKTSELRPVAESLFNVLLKRKGIPEDWDLNYSVSPVKVGLMEDLYMVPIIIEETNGSARTDEPVTVRITFDENCQNKTWNTTLRLYDEDDNEVNIEILNTTFCTNQFSNVSNITWNVNLSANQIKKYYLYYSPDDNVTEPNFIPLAYNTSSWIPSDRDEWTDNETANFSYWSRNNGVSGFITNDTTNKIRGNSSINISDTFPSNSMFGLNYNETDNITGLSNYWYLDVWLYVDNTSGLSEFRVYVRNPPSGSPWMYTDVLGNMTSAEWYHFVKILDPNQWDVTGGGTFNASNGIDNLYFNLYNSSSGLTRTLKVDGLHFKKEPLTVKIFPEEYTNSISYNKFDTMKNLSYDELKKTIGEYKLSVKIDGETYGGQVNQSANAVCYQNPSIIQYTNGTIKKIIPKLCVWK